MADTTVEIFKGTITPASIGSGNTSQTLVTTDASTRYVIRDVNVGTSTFPSAATPYLAVSDFNTGVSLTSGAKFSGTEIVDVSSTIKAAFSSLSATIVTLSYPTTSGPSYQKIGELNRILNGTRESGTSVSATYSGYFTSETNGYFVAGDGDCFLMYNDGNSVSRLEKYAGGWGGTQTIVKSLTWSRVTYAGGGIYYWLESGNVYKYDANTETTTSVATSASMPTSSYPRLNYNGGLLYSYPGTGYSNSFDIINPDNGYRINVNVSGFVGSSSSTSGFAGYRNPSTGIVTIFQSDNVGTDFERYTLNTPVNIPTSNTTYSGTVSTATLLFSTLGMNTSPHLVALSDTSVIALNGSNAVTQFSVGGATSSWAAVSVLSTGNYASSYYKFDAIVSTATSGQLADFVSALSLRITGVKSV